MRSLWIISILVCACASPGYDTPSVKKRRVKKEKTAKDDNGTSQNSTSTTSVGFGLLGGDLATPPSCSLPQEPATLIDLKGAFVLDGNADEWPSKPVFEDKAADHLDALDIVSTRIGKNVKQTRQDIVGAITFSQSNLPQAVSAGSAVYLEFGRNFIDTTVPSNDLRQKADRLFRFDSQGFGEYINDSWDVFATEGTVSIKGGFKMSATQIEWLLDERQLDEVKAATSWWVRVYTLGPGGALDDSTAAQLFNKDGVDNQPTFSLSRCFTDTAGMPRILLQQLSENSMPATTINAVFNVARLALQDVETLLQPEAFPERSLIVILTNKGVHQPNLYFPLASDEQYVLGLPLVIDDSVMRNLNIGHYENLYKMFVAKFLNIVLYKKFRTAPFYLRDTVSFCLQDYLESRRLNLSRWLSYYREFVTAFTSHLDLEAPLSLRTRQELVDQAPDEQTQKLLRQELNAKINSFGHILNATIKAKHVLAAWARAANVNSGNAEEKFVTSMREILTGVGSPIDSDSIWPGWLFDGPYHPEYLPNLLRDDDEDGLPNYYENAIGTNFQKVDSDQDGWSDYAELTTNKDPLNAANKPKFIVADNYFGDWEELLPSNIKSQTTRITPGCPQASQITSLIALADTKRLIFGSFGAADWDKGITITWELQIDLVSIKRKFLLVARSGDDHYIIKDTKTNSLVATFFTPMPQALRTGEWLIDFEDLGIDRQTLRKNKNIKLKISSIYDSPKRMLCNESEWFLPMQSQ